MIGSGGVGNGKRRDAARCAQVVGSRSVGKAKQSTARHGNGTGRQESTATRQRGGVRLRPAQQIVLGLGSQLDEAARGALGVKSQEVRGQGYGHKGRSRGSGGESEGSGSKASLSACSAARAAVPGASSGAWRSRWRSSALTTAEKDSSAPGARVGCNALCNALCGGEGLLSAWRACRLQCTMECTVRRRKTPRRLARVRLQGWRTCRHVRLQGWGTRAAAWVR